MKQLTLFFIFFSSVIFSQINTEIHVFDLFKDGEKYLLKNGKNLSNNPGYDSQPYFFDDSRVIFASTRNGNTDIALYDLKQNNPEFYYISQTEKGGEYSPQRIPFSSDVSAVRLDDNGLQRFYRYHYKTKKPTELIADLKVAYPAWFDKKTVVAVSIVNDSLELFVCDLKMKKNISVAKHVGRSVHKIPNSELMSFTSKENKENWVLKSLNPKTNEIKTITSLGKSEDVTWLPNGILLISKGNSIYQFNPKKDKQPKLFFSFTDKNIHNISRITVNSNGTKLALVAEVSPEYLAQEQLDGYNNRDIEAFLKPYAKNVKVYKYPNKLNYEGLEKMRVAYANFFKNTKDLHCKLLKRIVHKNKVIDYEFVTANGHTFKAVAIYTMENGKIISVTFM
jgi:hypothetical protein